MQYISELPDIIPSNSKLMVVGYPKSNSSYFLEEGTSSSPVFIPGSERFLLLGVVFAQHKEKRVGVIIKQRYVSELLDFTVENFQKR